MVGSKTDSRKMRKFCQSPRHLGEILMLIVLVVPVDLFDLSSRVAKNGQKRVEAEQRS